VANSPSLHRVALWRDRVSRQPSSGLTIARFCAQERCALAAFHAWKRRFRLMDIEQPPRVVPASQAFLPVTVRVVETAADQLPPIVAELPNGIRLRIPTSNVRLACRLVRAVARANTGSGGSR
jgi:hypothetical protein